MNAPADRLFAGGDSGHLGQHFFSRIDGDHNDAIVVAHNDITGMDSDPAKNDRDVRFAAVRLGRGFGMISLKKSLFLALRVELQR